MNDELLHPGNIAAATVVIGGTLIMVWPRHGLTIVGLMIVTLAAAAGLYALALNSPPAWWLSPFERRAHRRSREAGEAEWIRATLSGRRQAIVHGPPIPPGTLRLLQPLIRGALVREGLDPDDRASIEAARASLAPATWALLRTEPLKHATRFRTLRPDPRAVARAVNDVLDDLDRLDPRNLRET